MTQQPRSTFVLRDHSEILEALVGLKDVVVLHYERRRPDVELGIEQLIRDRVRCPSCAVEAAVKERPVVHYVDLSVYGTPMSLAWKKHRMRCVNERCPKKTWMLSDHRNAAKKCLLTTRAAQVVDPFHVIALANRCLDSVRRRVQGERSVRRNKGNDPLYRARRVLVMGEEKLDAEATARLWSLLELGDPHGEVAIAYRVKERLRDFYRCPGLAEARSILEELVAHCCKGAMPPEIQKLGRTIEDWFDKIVNFHLARVSNGPTEALNNLIKRIKRIGFGFRNFENYRIRALLYADKPNWRVLGSIVVQ